MTETSQNRRLFCPFLQNSPAPVDELHRLHRQRRGDDVVGVVPPPAHHDQPVHLAGDEDEAAGPDEAEQAGPHEGVLADQTPAGAHRVDLGRWSAWQQASIYNLHAAADWDSKEAARIRHQDDITWPLTPQSCTLRLLAPFLLLSCDLSGLGFSHSVVKNCGSQTGRSHDEPRPCYAAIRSEKVSMTPWLGGERSSRNPEVRHRCWHQRSAH